jgi:5-methylthioribose kinase
MSVQHPSAASRYRTLDLTAVPSLLADLADVRSRLGGRPEDWQIREVGDGNLNLVFLVDGPAGSVCVKQALPYVRAAGPSWPMSLERAFFENAYYQAVAPHVGRRIPEIYHYDPDLYCTIMERLSPHVILRQGLVAGNAYPDLALHMGEYVARACFFTSDLAQACERKMSGVTVFAGNQALTRISIDLIFSDPYLESERNRHTSPQLDGLVGELRADVDLKIAVARFGSKFLTQAEALLHGDLHSGSVMVTAGDTRVIDPEFALYGPIGFDLGAFLGNLLLNAFAQPGHATAADDRRGQQDWVLDQARRFWLAFRACFLGLLRERAGEGYPGQLLSQAAHAAQVEVARNAYLQAIFADMLGFAACKMIRRILGFAHVIDFEAIEDPSRRAACEARALKLARRLLKHPADFASIDALIDAASVMAHHQQKE